ncbi:transposase [Nostoc sp. CHAB 5784]|uniref:transposase n=1 Tax=Nostoc mirabile TaxID=2907820 RepID=UPI001E5A0677|nr:transposase [Nostoc mirabile]MCC5668165.1 transposase [Nostoc mirabile CHAB5784]
MPLAIVGSIEENPTIFADSEIFKIILPPDHVPKSASVLNMSPYSPDFNPIELWWSQLKAFLRQFSPTTTKMVDILIATALDLINPKHLKNWFTDCCYCTS